MGSNADRRSRKPRTGYDDLSRNSELTVGLGDATNEWGADKPMKSIGRVASFWSPIDAVREVSRVGRSGNLGDRAMTINPPALTDTPTIDSGDLSRPLWGGDVTLGTAASEDITTVSGRRKAASALNLPSVPKSRRKLKQQKARGRA